MTSKMLSQRTQGTLWSLQPLPPMLALARRPSLPLPPPLLPPAVPPIQSHYVPPLLFPGGGFAAAATAAAAAASFLLFLCTSLKGGKVHTLSLHSPSTNRRASVCFRAASIEDAIKSECRAGFSSQNPCTFELPCEVSKAWPPARGHASSAFACYGELVSCSLWILKVFTGMKWSGLLLFIRPECP